MNCICGSSIWESVFEYDRPPEGETRFSFSSKSDYHRTYRQCRVCGHFVQSTEMNLQELYDQDYVSTTYGDAEGVQRTFDRINSLPPEKSDNVGRVACVQAFARDHFGEGSLTGRALLDVGSGLGVFPYRMKQAGWECTGLDTDERLTQHTRDVVGVRAVCGYFGETRELGRYDVITFNKVLEHVEDPVDVLSKSRRHLDDSGFVYVEVPDGEEAAREGKEREEFFIEHLHVFSAASLLLMGARAGFVPVRFERLQEPSSKYTLRAFLKANPAS